MVKKRKKGAIPKPPQKRTNKKVTKLSFSEGLKKSFREKRLVSKEPILYNYHSLPFLYFHELIQGLKNKGRSYRHEFWKDIPDGVYDYSSAKEKLERYKSFIEDIMKGIIEKYSISYWLHLTRRIAPNTMGEDRRPETIVVCRNIIVAAIQKYALIGPCNTIKLSTQISVEDVFKGLLLKPGFELNKKAFLEAPEQLMLTDFDEKNIFEYYELEKLAYEMWLTGAKSRVISKGADLVVKHNDKYILLDNRNEELSGLISNYDERVTAMTASATGTVFLQQNVNESGRILLPAILTDHSPEVYSDPVTELLGIKFAKGNFPNYEFKEFDIKTFLHSHMEYASAYHKKRGVRLELVVAVITDISFGYMSSIITDRNAVTAANIISRGYQIFDLQEYKHGLVGNWSVVNEYLGIDLAYNEIEIDNVISHLTLTELNRKDIYVDSFGPLKIFIPATQPDSLFLDLSVLGEVLYNLFYNIPLADRGFKGRLLEDALTIEESFLPTTASKGMDGTSKQVDFSVVRDDLLILVECKAVARSFGIFDGDPKALDHRMRNVISKGLDDVDKKVKWFIEHQKGTNYDISHLKYVVGIVVSPFAEFISSREERYWLNGSLPRVMNIDEFNKLLKSNLKEVIKKNVIALSA